MAGLEHQYEAAKRRNAKVPDSFSLAPRVVKDRRGAPAPEMPYMMMDTPEEFDRVTGRSLAMQNENSVLWWVEEGSNGHSWVCTGPGRKLCFLEDVYAHAVVEGHNVDLEIAMEYAKRGIYV